MRWILHSKLIPKIEWPDSVQLKEAREARIKLENEIVIPLIAAIDAAVDANGWISASIPELKGKIGLVISTDQKSTYCFPALPTLPPAVFSCWDDVPLIGGATLDGWLDFHAVEDLEGRAWLKRLPSYHIDVFHRLHNNHSWL